jgi:4,5-DOPA dioxygenase extradiol
VLIIGSGFTTHGLPFLRDFREDAAAPGWSAEFDAWTAETLSRGAVDELADFRHRAPGMPYAHPTIEHFAPMFLTFGASGDPEQSPAQPIDGFWMGLAKRSFLVNQAEPGGRSGFSQCGPGAFWEPLRQTLTPGRLPACWRSPRSAGR